MTTQRRRRLRNEGQAALAGVIAGGVLGVTAGPAGLVVGACVGAGIATLLELVAHDATTQRADRDAVLDREIGVDGVDGGELGAPNLEHPPASVGAYSGASAGLAGGGGDFAEGPMQTPS